MEEKMGRFSESLYTYAVSVDGAGIFKTSFRPVNLTNICTFIVFPKFKKCCNGEFFS